MKPITLIFMLLAAFFLAGCDSCEVVRVASGKLHFSDGKAQEIPHWNEEGWTHFFFVRHAEKVDQSDDPDLSAEGQARAQRLAEIMKNAGLNAVFATDKRRTQQTAEPVRQRANLPAVLQYPRADEAETLWLQTQLTENRGQRIFVVGHSNTVPRMVNKLMGGETQLPEIDEKNFSAFIIVASRSLGDSEYWWKQY